MRCSVFLCKYTNTKDSKTGNDSSSSSTGLGVLSALVLNLCLLQERGEKRRIEMKLERSKRRIVLWAVWVGFALLAPVAQADVLFSASSASGAVSKGYDASVVTIVTAPHVSAPDATGFAAVMLDRMSNDASWFSATGG